MLPRKFKMPPKAWRQGCRIQDRMDSNGKERDICSDENPLSEGHLRNAFVLSRCAKSGSSDRLTCKHTGGSAGSHTLTYMLHLAETERKREGQLMREVEGGAAVH